MACIQADCQNEMPIMGWIRLIYELKYCAACQLKVERVFQAVNAL